MFPSAALLIGGLLFSAIQYKNWLWATQIIQFLPPLCLVLCLRLRATGRATWLKVGGCALLSAVATFTAPNGMLCWVLAFPLFPQVFTEWRTRARRRSTIIAWTACYSAVAACCIVFYFWDYQQPPNHPPLDLVLRDPALGLWSFLVWIGSPIVTGLYGRWLGADNADVAAIAGAALMSLFCLATASLLAGVETRLSSPWSRLAGLGCAWLASASAAVSP